MPLPRLALIAAVVTLSATPALAWPSEFELTGRDDRSRELAGRLSLDAESRAFELHVAREGAPLELEGTLRAHDGALTAKARNRAARWVQRLFPWKVRVEPRGLDVTVTLTRGTQRLTLSGETPLGPRSAANEALIRSFYAAFARGDAATMAAAYAPQIHFSDPVFPHLHGSEVGAMWAMLCESAPAITFSGIRAGERYGVARWEARYEVFGRPIVNVIEAAFELEDGRIVRHVDRFSWSRWSEQAFGRIPTRLAGRVLHTATRLGAAYQLRSFRRDHRAAPPAAQASAAAPAAEDRRGAVGALGAAGD